MKGTVLGVKVYRGFARLCDLASISKADVYDQKLNPMGTQRDLNPAHARQAYEYVANRTLAFWPEVFLSLRDESVLGYEELPGIRDVGIITIRVGDQSNSIAISRVDGNHRLFYADGHTDGLPKIERIVSFCLAYELSLEDEIRLFRDINDNQRRMNTSHLDMIEARLTTEDVLKARDPELYIAQELGRDPASPLVGRVYEGGVRQMSWAIPLRTLKTGVEYLFSKSARVTAIPGVDAQYKVVRTYFAALKDLVPEAWEEPRKYLLLRGAGLWGACFLGAEVIDRVLAKGKFDQEAMVSILRSGGAWDWSNSGDFKGLSGRGGALQIANRIREGLSDEASISLKELAKKILES
jgi:DGQHR domain-containing protein